MDGLDDVKFEIRTYKNWRYEKLFWFFVLFLMGFGLLMTFIETPKAVIGGKLIVFAVIAGIVRYLLMYYFQKPVVEGEIVMSKDSVKFKDSKFPIEEMNSVLLNFKDFRGRIHYMKREYLPRLGDNNELTIILKSHEVYKSNFFVNRKKDRKKIDPFIKLWSDKDIRTQYLIDDEMVFSNA